VKTAPKGQGEAVMDDSLVYRVVLKAVL